MGSGHVHECPFFYLYFMFSRFMQSHTQIYFISSKKISQNGDRVVYDEIRIHGYFCNDVYFPPIFRYLTQQNVVINYFSIHFHEKTAWKRPAAGPRSERV